MHLENYFTRGTNNIDRVICMTNFCSQRCREKKIDIKNFVLTIVSPTQGSRATQRRGLLNGHRRRGQEVRIIIISRIDNDWTLTWRVIRETFSWEPVLQCNSSGGRSCKLWKFLLTCRRGRWVDSVYLAWQLQAVKVWVSGSKACILLESAMKIGIE